MTEKVLLALLLLVLGALGWFVREMLADIKGTQKEHGSSLSNIKMHVLRIEDKQNSMSSDVERLKVSVTDGGAVQRETKSVLDRNLYEMRQQLKEQTDDLFVQKQNFGKVILIVQKLYAATRNGQGK